MTVEIKSWWKSDSGDSSGSGMMMPSGSGHHPAAVLPWEALVVLREDFPAAVIPFGGGRLVEMAADTGNDGGGMPGAWEASLAVEVTWKTA